MSHHLQIDHAQPLDEIITLCRLDSDTLVAKYKQALDTETEAEAEGIVNGRSGMGVLRSKPSHVYALILSHRRDKSAVDFYKT